MNARYRHRKLSTGERDLVVQGIRQMLIDAQPVPPVQLPPGGSKKSLMKSKSEPPGTSTSTSASRSGTPLAAAMNECARVVVDKVLLPTMHSMTTRFGDG